MQERERQKRASHTYVLTLLTESLPTSVYEMAQSVMRSVFLSGPLSVIIFEV